jgi:hypothetical protein
VLSLFSPLTEAAINALDTTLKNPSNTRVTYWAGRLLTHFEAALPYEVSGDTGGKPKGKMCVCVCFFLFFFLEGGG